MEKWQCRWSPTLGELEDTHQKVWGTRDYADNFIDNEKPAVFFGLYGLPDFYTLWRHKGIKEVLWAGSDILHFRDGYWLEDDGAIRLDPKALAYWLSRNCGHWVENEVERRALLDCGIFPRVCPSFLGDVKKFKVSYKPSKKPKLYTSVSGDNFQMYGWHKINEAAANYPNIEFHLYGSNNFRCEKENVFVHGRVPKEQMNEETSKMQGALRLTEFDGFSEILAKSILWGQWPISLIEYPYMLKVSELDKLKNKTKPNLEGREYYLKNINKYPWVL
jgi:hypothetical protein